LRALVAEEEVMMTAILLRLRSPAVFAPEGVFKGLDEVEKYFNSERRYYESESAHW
jgi:hypothetical protein